VFIDHLFEAHLILIGEGSIQVANGSEGSRRHAIYSKCFTPTAVRRYYDIYNQVTCLCVVVHCAVDCAAKKEFFCKKRSFFAIFFATALDFDH